jgi:cell division septation protein DedD
MAVFDEGFAPSTGAPRATNLVNYAGAAVSLALIAGVSVWGFHLVMRDVSGIPVVRAMEGDMRVLPDNPGGAVALHTGLAVNEVAAMGEAGGLEDRLVLAPRTTGLAQEDLEAQPISEVAAVLEDIAQTEVTTPVVAPLTDDADQIASLAAQLSATTTAIAAPLVEVIPASVPGVTSSMRPLERPASLQVVATAPAATLAAEPTEIAVTTEPFPAGTNLVQLGAFPNPSLAAAEWARLQQRFGGLMAGRDRVIQVSNQSSGTWYRLRASGFADRADARRLCAALQAENTDCIAVVVN